MQIVILMGVNERFMRVSEWAMSGTRVKRNKISSWIKNKMHWHKYKNFFFSLNNNTLCNSTRFEDIPIYSVLNSTT